MSYEELERRQAALRSDAATILAELDTSGVFERLGTILPTGSYVSGLMTWPEIDIMLAVGSRFAPADVLDLLRRIVEIPGVVDMHYTDERGSRAPTDAVRDERYHVTIGMERPGTVGPAKGTASAIVSWRIDLSLWLHDDHASVTAWHEELRDSITDDQRRAVLRIKDVWHRTPRYPDEVSGLDIYTAVLDAGVRTPEQFGGWLAERDGRQEP
ncbi:hypothetical protein [Actinopolymorpha rutila]|uniref:Nucleotidyl transferase AbiEii toxin, Type IV TA system n=1 Tax=Actinopolymorpha rutila TaxID=446787 RepID=A0A852ZKR9_9ACTN|nr:hypothetical protein [Actinopolymorpha rutila]NYH92813.1 hypothetical protein [Actinopolymorpha rutila]